MEGSAGLSPSLGGSMTALVTPFRRGGIDERAFVHLCRRQIERGTTALVPCGTTGEASTLSHGEQVRLIELAVGAAAGRVPVIAGAGSNCTESAVQLVRAAESCGADAILSVVPYYNRPSQEGLYQHFKAIQASTGLPILLYDVPARTGTTLALDTILRLAELPNIVGLKDASGDLARALRLRQVLGGEFLLLCGDEARLQAYLSLGCQGCISVAANVAPAACAALHRVAHPSFRFDVLRDRLAPLVTALSLESNPIPVKWALSRLGLIEDELRLPLTPLAERYRAEVAAALDLALPAEAEEADRFTTLERDRRKGRIPSWTAAQAAGTRAAAAPFRA